MNPRVLGVILDFDGGAFGWRYINTVRAIINNYENFFKACGEENIDPNDNYIQKKITEVLDTVKNTHQPNVQLFERDPHLYPFIDYMNNISKDILASILIQANEPLIKWVRKRIEIFNANIVVLITGSNRGDFELDKLGMIQNCTNSSVVDLVFFGEYLQRLFPSKTIIVSEYSPTDGQSSLPRGTTQQKILDEYAFPPKSYQDHAIYFYDDTKIFPIYGAIHDTVLHVCEKFGIKFKDMIFEFDFLEDQEGILSTQAKIYAEHSILLPDGVMYNIIPHDGEIHEDAIQTIKGTGIVDRNYPKNMRLMITMAGYDLNSVYDKIDVGSNLDFDLFNQKRITGWEIIPYKNYNHFFQQSVNNDNNNHHGQDVKVTYKFI